MRCQEAACCQRLPLAQCISKFQAVCSYKACPSTLFKLGTRNPVASPRLQRLSEQKSAENRVLDCEALVNQSVVHATPLSCFRRVESDATHKTRLIKAAAKKGPKATQAAVDAATKAAKRRDSYAKKLHVLGVDLKDGAGINSDQAPCCSNDASARMVAFDGRTEFESANFPIPVLRE